MMMHTKPNRIRLFPAVCAAAVIAVLGTACGGSGWNPNDPTDTREATVETAPADEVEATVAKFKAKDPTIEVYFENCHGYAVFPTVGKGGLWVGGAHGKGVVVEQGQRVGRTSITQLTAGPQIGGQAYSEIIFFKNAHAMRKFKKGNYELGAQVSAVALDEGAARNAAYEDGVAVFTLAKKGLMAEATVAGQKFAFEPDHPATKP